MKLLKLSFTCLQVIATSFCADAQGVEYRPLQKGDLLPPINVTISEGEARSVVNLQQYKGKLILLDFWGVRCSSCIEALPKMMTLQEKFKDDIKIIVVTDNSEIEIKKLVDRFKNNPAAKNWIYALSKLPLIKSDSVMRVLYPHLVVPTHVWIGPDQRLLSIAYSTTTTEENIRLALDYKEVKFDEPRIFSLNKRDPISWLDLQSPVLPLLESYSFLTRRIEFGMGGEWDLNWMMDSASKKARGVTIVNYSLLELYKFAYSEKNLVRAFLPTNRIVISTLRPALFELQGKEEDYFTWANAHIYSYALKLSTESRENIYSHVASDLDRFFGLRSFVEKRKTMCWVLKRISANEPFRFVSGKKYYHDADSLVIKGYKMEALFNAFDDQVRIENPDLPYIDITGYSGAIDIAIPWLINGKKPSLEFANRQLSKYGLSLVKEYVELDMLVIADQ